MHSLKYAHCMSIPYDGLNTILYDPVKRCFPMPTMDEFATMAEWLYAVECRDTALQMLASTTVNRVGAEKYYKPVKNVQHTYQLRSRIAAAHGSSNQ